MSIFPEYESFDGLGLANLVHQGIVSPEEILEAAIERIEKYNPALNAVVHKMYDQAKGLIQAHLPDGIFQGVPILLKNLSAEYQGAPLSFGSRFTRDMISTFDSEIVVRLKRAGVMVLGRTNVPEFGLNPVTESKYFGPAHNPWNLSRSPGGSSGGAAAAVAARMVPIAHAGDGGGSIRIPAAYCGVFGFKPSRGRTPIGPVVSRLWLGMVTEHVITRTVRDSAAMLDVLAGPEIGSPISLAKPVYSFLKSLDQTPKSLRIALVEEPFFTAKLHSEYKDALYKTAKLLTDLGHHVEPVSYKIDRDEIGMAFLILMTAETAAGVKELIKFVGREPDSQDLEKATSVICHAGEQFSAADYAWAVQVLDRASKQLAVFFENYDVILTPTMPHPAPEIGVVGHTEIKLIHVLLRYFPYGKRLRQAIYHLSKRNFEYMSYTALFNIGGEPAMSVPLWWDSHNMPIGMQFAAKTGDDLLLLQLAKQLEDAQPWERRQPAIQASSVAIA